MNSLVDSGGLTCGSMASMAFRGSDPIVSGEPEAAEPEAAPLWLKGRSTLPMVSVEELNTTQESPQLIFDPFVFFLKNGFVWTIPENQSIYKIEDAGICVHKHTVICHHMSIYTSVYN